MATVEFGVAASNTGFKAAFTVAVFKFVTEDSGGSIRMKAAFFLVFTHLDKPQATVVNPRYRRNHKRLPGKRANNFFVRRR
jgi:hypothetical protein